MAGATAAVCLCLACGAAAQPAQPPDLEAELAALRVPPPWLLSERLDYDVSQPWKEARLHVRKLLDQGDNRRAIATTYDYIVTRHATPDDHEYALYLYLGREYAWAVRIYRERLGSNPARDTMEYLNLTSLYLHYGRPQEALALLTQGLAHLPKPPWDIPNQAKLCERTGDVQVRLGLRDEAHESYAMAMATYPLSQQPWGRENLPKHVSRIQAKRDLLARGHGRLHGLRDGSYQGNSIAYAGDLTVGLDVRNGRVADLRVSHQEHIEQGATRLVPAEILRKQSLEADAVTGATITREAIIEGAYRAAVKAGLK